MCLRTISQVTKILFNPNFWWLRKSTFRHRATSTAFHSARKRAEKLGHTPETCKAMGRSAAAEIRNQIDAGLLEED